MKRSPNVEPARSVSVKSIKSTAEQSHRASDMVAIAPARAGWIGLGKLTLGDWRGEAAAIAVMIPMLLAPVLWNGFPIIYYDTGAYVLQGLGGHFIVERSSVYSLFLRFGGAGASLWLIALIQSGTTAFAITELARATFPRLPLGLFLAIGAALVIGTGLPWYVGQIEPDCFTALVVLALYLLAFHLRDLGRIRAAILVLVGGFSAAAHPSHLLLAGFLAVLLIAGRVALRFANRASIWPKPRLAEPLLVCLLGLAFVLAGNFYFTRQVFVTRAGSSFVFARMLQDGIV
ncbi:MAG TPA: hypothetical protein VIY09_05045, partial [Rhizomicrobium sp.]